MGAHVAQLLVSYKLAERFEIKTEVIGAGPQDSREESDEVRSGMRSSFQTRGADHKGDDHARRQGGKHPGEGENTWREMEQEAQGLPTAQVMEHRAIAARANYLSADRPDIQYAVKEICRRMAKPVKGGWHKLVRLGKYRKRSTAMRVGVRVADPLQSPDQL